MLSENRCPCYSGAAYKDCCQNFHLGKVLPQNALQLMRSRFSAFACNLSDYIVQTTHPASPQYCEDKFSWKREISHFSKNTTFHRLKILDFKENQSTASVTFTAYISQDGHDMTFTEQSFFEKWNQRWLYRSGKLEEGEALQLITKSPLKILPLAYYETEVLRKKAEPVIEITKDVKELVEEMIETMISCDGLGLAAPQVHRSLRLFITHAPIGIQDEEQGEIEIYINPTLSDPSVDVWEAPEGCLSIPTIHTKIIRPKEITVEYTTLNGTKKKKRCTGWEAKAVMHEYDHIEGILFIDRIQDAQERAKIEPILKKIEKRIHGS